nr:hypothetical protein [Sporomusa silvacetica]
MLELILEKISTLEAKVCRSEVVVKELILETHGYARTEKPHEDD